MLATDKMVIKKRLRLTTKSLKKLGKGKRRLAISLIKNLNYLIEEKDSSLKKAQIISLANNLKAFFSPPDHFDSIEKISNNAYLALEDLIQRVEK
jgi:hypothetical protein